MPPASPSDSRSTPQTLLVTGAAGFIGFHTARRLLERGENVVGFDNVNAYYDVALKEARLKLLCDFPNFQFVRGDICELETLVRVFEAHRPAHIVHLAGQAGVRDSLQNPQNYLASNIAGFLNVLEACRQFPVAHLVYASSGSVYGLNRKMPFSPHDPVSHPASLYAASKQTNELMAHAYSHLFQIPTTGLRFFSVYGPWGRPDMALFQFTESILAGRPIDVYNHGEMRRDFTYIDDIVEGILRLLDLPPAANPDWDAETADPAASAAPYRIYNIGGANPVDLREFIALLERAMGKTVEKNYLPMQVGDIAASHADVSDLLRDTGFQPETPLKIGIARFVAWYRKYYRV